MCVCVFQVDNKGNHLLVHEESSINVPAIAAAHVIKRYIAQASDELSFEVTAAAVLHVHCLHAEMPLKSSSSLSSFFLLLATQNEIMLKRDRH